MSYTVDLVIRIMVATALAVIFGNGSVVAFNNIKPSWFADYPDAKDIRNTGSNSKEKNIADKEKTLPPKLVEADSNGRQRLPSTPWKFAFVGYFGIVGIYLAIRGGSVEYEIYVMCVLFVLLEMSICDYLYMVVPDQFSIALALMSVVFAGYYENWWEPIAGAGIGLLLSLSILGLGLLIYKTGSIGGADIKFFTCMGLIAGRGGIVIIFILTTIFFAIQSVVRISMGKGTIKDSMAMLPAGCMACTIYFLFLWNVWEIWIL
ncbi:MAG: prepilin peptidase [Clostridiales bacterium]|nr:prepilin peptidase [Clostridiales bacterium]